MKRAPVLFAFACLLAGCNQPQAQSVDALAADPVRLHALRAQCQGGEHDGAFCARVAQADLRRFLSGQVGPDEYQALDDLPPIPASFDEPIAAVEGGP
ncbi:hypothetical protein RXE43_000655 [Pseudomonas aeruginosa]|uniref:hypothetical protein n=1 Tax=Pseudomonas aeruginosa TaxID=287 RepID=UPI0003C38A98|nr:hypothetical protein [Pseudomonas aeruginosa]ESR68847.1 hypothetical protein T266_23720 [Pseudomonas aeruginosa VRFPA05]EJV1369420.1 hypothetical protein [Pseudomonas aeruginosa]EJV1387225.1 hypothetical protein [Pseudomonas aeruginosa]EJV1609298.1 hypothetical protein [Pseudomonas aeruginosa]EKD1565247.1 hypothetical protein [Pseudomonas aeruginosa]